MTEKRFEFREINEPPIFPKVYDVEKQEYANLFECVGWLNELHEENQHKQKLLHLSANKIENLLEENQQLKKEIENLKQGMIHAAFDKEWK